MACFAHEDRTPSAAVNEDEEVQGYTCHSCGRSGDALKLLQSELRLSFAEAVEEAKRLCGEDSGPPRRKRRMSEIFNG
jgi:DNA primase